MNNHATHVFKTAVLIVKGGGLSEC